MTFRLLAASAIFLAFSGLDSEAQEILLTNSAAYVSGTTPRVTFNGYMETVTQSGATYQNVGMVLSNSYSTYNDIFSPGAGAAGTTFAYATTAPFGSLPSSKSWHVDMALPVQTLSTSPSSPTYITVSFYLVDNAGKPYNNESFSTYCFMTYVSGGKVITSPAGGPYFVVLPPTATGVKAKQSKDAQVSAETGPKTRMLPPPRIQDAKLNGFWDVQPSESILKA
jgi:hypothetical protein